MLATFSLSLWWYSEVDDWQSLSLKMSRAREGLWARYYMTEILLSLCSAPRESRDLQVHLRLPGVDRSLYSTLKVQVSGFCSSLGLGASTKGLALLLTAAVHDDCGPKAQDTEVERCDQQHGEQADQNHSEGTNETVAGWMGTGAGIRRQQGQSLDPRQARRGSLLDTIHPCCTQLISERGKTSIKGYVKGKENLNRYRGKDKGNNGKDTLKIDNRCPPRPGRGVRKVYFTLESIKY